MSMILKLQKALAANVNTNPQDVFAAKTFLQTQGHYAAPEWGISEFPDRALFDAIKAFQKSNGLRVDGVMNPEGETEAATQSIQAAALNLQSLGRNGDTILAHITPDEAMMLKANGGAGTLNPKTGLLEFYGIHANNRARDKAERDSSANRSKTSSTNNKNDGNGSNKNKDKGFSFARNFAEDLGNLFSGNWTGPASAYDTRNAKALAKENKGNPKDYLRGGIYGPGGGGYSASALHAAGVKAQAKADRERTRQARQAQNNESRADQYSALAKTDEDPNLDTKSTQARPNQSASLYGPLEADQREINGPHQASSTQRTAPAQTARTASTKPTSTPGVDPSWASSPNHKDQVRNVLNTNARREQEREDAKAKQLADAMDDQRTKVAARAPGRTIPDAQLKGAAQAELSRKAASAKIQSQARAAKAAGAKANAAKAAQTQQARAVINLLTPTIVNALTVDQTPTAAAFDQRLSATIDDLKAEHPDKKYSYSMWRGAALTRINQQNNQAKLSKVVADIKANGLASMQAKPTAKVAAAIPTQKEDKILQKIAELKTKIHETKPDFELSDSAWRAAAMSDLAAENNQPKAKAQIDKFIADQKQTAEHKANYDQSVNNSQVKNGVRNDGFIGMSSDILGIKGNDINWKSNTDDSIFLGQNNERKTITLNVDGPIRISPTSITSGIDRATITVDWYGRDENGKVTPEFRSEDTKTRQHEMIAGYNSGVGYHDFAPPYDKPNANGYRVTITKPAQPDNSGNSAGMELNIYSREGDKPVERVVK